MKMGRGGAREMSNQWSASKAFYVFTPRDSETESLLSDKLIHLEPIPFCFP